MAEHLIVIYPPALTGGRRMRVDGEILGLAYSVRDAIEFLRRAGLDWDEADLRASPLVDWRGVSADVWTPEG
jgi:hypothetical protein